MDEMKEKRKVQTACLSSRMLAQYSTDRYAGGLYCRVRDGTGCFPAAMAVLQTRISCTDIYNLCKEMESGFCKTCFQGISWMGSDPVTGGDVSASKFPAGK